MKTPTPKLRDKLQAIIYDHTLNICSKEEVDLSAKKIYKGTIEAILSALREVVESKEKITMGMPSQGNRDKYLTNIGYNQALQDIANLFGG